MIRFAAKLIFYYDVMTLNSDLIEVDTEPGSPYTTELRIINFQSESFEQALDYCSQYGLENCLDYLNDRGERVYLRYAGIADMIDCDMLEEGEVWYDIKHLKNPQKMVRSKKKLLNRL